MYTVKQVSDLAGVTPRTLRYYDQIGLLKPASVGSNGYRGYSDDDLLRLQQIRFYRELDLPLAEIRQALDGGELSLQEVLESHRQALGRRMAHLRRLAQTVEDTILYLKGEKVMSRKQLFDVFNEEQQAEYEQEAMQRYDPAIVRASQAKWKRYTAEEKKRIGEEGNAIYAAIVEAIPLGPASPQAQQGVERWRRHMDAFWTPNPAQLLALAEGYNSDPRFKANFDRIDPRLAPFMLEAVRIYVANLS